MLSALELLDVWDQGIGQPAARRALNLLAVAYPECSPEALAGLSVGRRDALLLALRERLFGPHFASQANCPGCGELLELDFTADQIRSSPPAEPAGEMLICQDAFEVRFRLPDSRDLLAVADMEVPEAAQRLREGCIQDARRRGRRVSMAALPDDLVAMVEAQILAADPQSEVQIALTCPDCERPWSELFDILTCFWEEIQVWAGRLLRDVHTIASAYGWCEREILALSPRRRQIYLELLSP
jgi:hypothetical protein